MSDEDELDLLDEDDLPTGTKVSKKSRASLDVLRELQAENKRLTKELSEARFAGAAEGYREALKEQDDLETALAEADKVRGKLGGFQTPLPASPIEQRYTAGELLQGLADGTLSQPQFDAIVKAGRIRDPEPGEGSGYRGGRAGAALEGYSGRS